MSWSGSIDVEQISIALDFSVVAGLVPATPTLKAQSKNNRGGRDKPGHDLAENDGTSI
jgi:hypothetical protein